MITICLAMDCLAACERDQIAYEMWCDLCAKIQEGDITFSSGRARVVWLTSNDEHKPIPCKCGAVVYCSLTWAKQITECGANGINSKTSLQNDSWKYVCHIIASIALSIFADIVCNVMIY